MVAFSFKTPDGLTYKYPAAGALSTFVTEEIAKWDWLVPYRKIVAGQWIIDSVLTPLRNAQSLLGQQPVSEEVAEMAKVQLQLYFDSVPPLHPKAILRQIVDQKYQKSPLQTIYMLAAIGQHAGKWGELTDQHGVQSSYISGLAQGLAFVNGWQPEEKAHAASQAAIDAARAADEALAATNTAKNDAEETLNFFKEWEIAHRERLSSLNDTIRRDHERLSAELAESVAATTKNLQDEWKALTATYDSQLSLRAPATYWGKKHKRHTNWVTLLAIGGFFWLIVGVLALNTLAKAVFGLTTIGSVPSWFQVISFSLGALVFVLVLRSLMRLMMSHVHLSLDAAERQTMIVSYLALMRKGALKEETLERVLGAIFRPTGDGIVKDDGMPLSVFAEMFKKP